MHSPVDPWDPSDTAPLDLPPRSAKPTPMYGRAPVPVPGPPPLEPTGELPAPVPVAPARRRLSWQRTSRASARRISDGWGFTATGLIVAFSGWGVWAAALRGTGSSLAGGLVFVLMVAGGLFALARFLGYLIVTRLLHRPRMHARWAHFLTGLFLTVAGISYLINTTWLADAGDWLREGVDRARGWWPRG